MLDAIANLWNVLLVIVGFGLVIVVHELGHFLAARWAGVRVHAFAVGFGKALLSWRAGLGLRRGSSEAEYLSLLRDPAGNAGPLSPTEYRLNWIPFGGYVKMLGQDDLAPGNGADAAPDSYLAKPVWKRMVIISGGVAMNLLLAAVVFVATFMLGVREIAPVIGEVAPGSPAAAAGLRAGDELLEIDGAPARSFNALVVATAMAGPNDPVRLRVRREGAAAPIDASVIPVRGSSGLLQIGVAPASSARLMSDVRAGAELEEFERTAEGAGLAGVRPAMRLASIDGRPLAQAPGAGAAGISVELERAVRASGGRPLALEFVSDGPGRARAPGTPVRLSVTPARQLQLGVVPVGTDRVGVRHLVGLVPVMRVAQATSAGESQGLRDADVFVRIGAVEWPSVAAGTSEIRAHAGKEIDLVVLRAGERVSLRAAVSPQGRIGFVAGDTSATSARLAATPQFIERRPAAPGGAAGAEATWQTAPPAPAQRLAAPLLPGTRIVAVNGTDIASFDDLWDALRAATFQASASGAGADVPLALELPVPEHAPARETQALQLTPEDVQALHALSYDPDPLLGLFETAQVLNKASGPLDALDRGVAKTKEVILLTYLTFLRLFQGTVPVDQIKGPVGITHLGSRVARLGLVDLVFFFGLISANLAVINFLPMPVVDGGHMVFLAWEGLTGRPVSVAIQNIATIAGLALIGGVFLLVTINDVLRLVG